MLRSRYLPEFVYGGMDGLVTTFAIVTGGVGAGFSANIILILGFANVLADAFSMGASSYLSAESESAIAARENGKRPLRRAFATFFSFVLVGSVPLAPFVASFLIPSLSYAIVSSVIITGFAFALVGYFSGIAERKNPLTTALRNLSIGGAAALLAYVVGAFLADIVK